MKTYLIAYTLEAPAITEGLIINKIKAYQNWARPLPNVWLIHTMSAREDIMNYLITNIGLNDRLLIMEVTGNWISFNLPADVLKWLEDKH